MIIDAIEVTAGVESRRHFDAGLEIRKQPPILPMLFIALSLSRLYLVSVSSLSRLCLLSVSSRLVSLF